MKHRFNALMSQIWETNDDQRIMALLEEAIVIADQYLTETDAHRARMTYTERAVEFGYHDKMLVSFSWCWAKFVEHPERYSSYYMMWHLKWVAENLGCFAIYSMTQIRQLFELFKDQSEKYRYSLRPYYEAYTEFLMHSGKLEKADRHFQQWRKAERDGLSNCLACEQHTMGEYYFTKGHYKRGLQALKPIMEGKLSCRHIPRNTYAMVITPYLALAQYDEAQKYADKAYRLLKGTNAYYQYGTLIAYYAITNRRRAMQIYRNTYDKAIRFASDWGKLHYLVGVQILMEQTGQKQTRKRKASLSEPDYVWVRSEVERLVQAFDERNQNQYVSQRVAGLRKQYEKLKRIVSSSTPQS